MRARILAAAFAPVALVACSLGGPTAPVGPTGSPGAADCDALLTFLDRNRDGKLVRTEYVDGMLVIEQARNPKGEVMTSCGKRDLPVLLGQGFDVTDADMDGSVSREEFLTRCEGGPLRAGVPLPYLRPAACRTAFAKADADDDGRWSKEEFQSFWGLPNFPYGPIQPHAGLRYALLCSPARPNYDALFARFDEDGDGGIAQDEACAFLTGDRPLPSPKAEASPTPVPSPSATGTPSPSPSPSASPSPSPSPSASASPGPSPSASASPSPSANP